MTKEFKDAIPQLNIEVLENGCIRLESESIDDNYIVDIHPVQLRYIAEKMGLIATSDPQALKTIAALQRRMILLSDRIGNLHNYLVNHSDHRHADLTYEVTYANATADMADEFCAEFMLNDSAPVITDRKQTDTLVSTKKQVTTDNAIERKVTNAVSVTTALPASLFDAEA